MTPPSSPDMPAESGSEETLFAAALQWETPAQRAAYLDEACAGNPALRARVEGLLQASSEAQTFLERPVGVARPSPGATATVKFADLAPLTEGPGTRIGRYKLLQQIGEGGCGTVFMAEQEEPVRRRVALKVIKLGMDTKSVVTRFEAERQALALMDHPNIAKVLDAGATDSGRPYFVMELVRGIPITRYCDENKLDTRQRLDLFIKVCQALQHAHQKGIIHRDIKPSNILVTLHDGVPVPKVIDFGIAKATEGRLTDRTLFTAFEQFIGTPAYMSPEQAELSGLDMDTRSDIYALGVLLYELLTGRTPFDAKELAQAGLDEMRRRIREVEPPRPSTRLSTLQGDTLMTTAQAHGTDVPKLLSLIRGDLDWIVMKCLEKDRTRRYETANGLAADLKRHLDSEPVTARPPSTAYRFQKAFRRNRLAFAAGTAVSFALLLGLIAATWQAVRATRAEREQTKLREAAETAGQAALTAKTQAEQAQAKEAGERQRAEASERATRELLYSANMGLAQTAWEEGDMRRLQGLLTQTRDDPQRGFEWFYWARQLHRDTLTFREHRGSAREVEFSPDGQWIASAYRSSLKIWSAADGQVRHEVKLDTGLSGLAFSPDGTRLAARTLNQKLQVRDTWNGQIIREAHLGPTNQVWKLAWSPDGSRILGTGGLEEAWLWDVDTSQELRRITQVPGHAVLPWFSPEGQPRLAVRDEAGIQVWDVTTRETLVRFAAPGADTVATLSRDQSRLVALTGHGIIHLFDVRSGRELRQWRAGAGMTRLMHLSHDGRYLATTEGNGTIWIRDTGSGEELGALKGHGQQILGISFSPDGQKLASASADETIRIWNWPGLKEPASSFETHPRLQIFLSRDGAQAVVVTNRAPGSRPWSYGLPNTSNPGEPAEVEARVVDTRTGHTQAVLPGLTGGVAQFTPDGRRVAAVSTNASRAHVWDSFTGRVLVTLDVGTNRIVNFKLSPDGRQIATAEMYPNVPSVMVVKLWDSVTGRRQFTLKANQDALHPLAFSPDSRRLLTGAYNDPFAVVWNTLTGQEESRIDSTLSGVVFGAFSPDGERVILANFLDVMLRLQPVRPEAGTDSGFVIHSQIVGPNPVFSPDGRRILTEAGGTAKLWDADTGRDLLTLKTPPYARCQFTPDGQAIISARPDGTLLRWEAATPAQVAVWEAADEARISRRRVASARNFTDSLLRSRRYADLEAAAREVLEALPLRAEEEPDDWVEFTLRLATSLLSRVDVERGKGESVRAAALQVEAEELLGRITNEQLGGYLRENPRYDMGGFLAQAGHWPQAEAFVKRISEAEPTNNIPWQLRAALLARMGNESELANVRSRLLELLPGLTNSALMGWGIRSVVLKPLDASTAAAVERLAERAVEVGQDINSQSWLPLAQALARYRNRNFTGALTSLEKAEAATDHPSYQATLYLVAAMTHFQLGQRDKAESALREGAALVKENWFSAERGALEGDGWWVDWLSADLLLQEARGLIEGRVASPETSKPSQP